MESETLRLFLYHHWLPSLCVGLCVVSVCVGCSLMCCSGSFDEDDSVTVFLTSKRTNLYVNVCAVTVCSAVTAL